MGYRSDIKIIAGKNAAKELLRVNNKYNLLTFTEGENDLWLFEADYVKWYEDDPDNFPDVAAVMKVVEKYRTKSGKENGICAGRAGKMHQTAPEVGVLSANGIVGASQTLGTGHALYCSLFAPGRVSIAFFGDGGGNQGAFHESMNVAALWKLPVIFVCENNHYGISMSQDRHQAIKDIADRGAGQGVQTKFSFCCCKCRKMCYN